MVELGKYAGTVLGAYGVTLVLLAGLICVSLWRGAKMRERLKAQEKRMGRDG